MSIYIKIKIKPKAKKESVRKSEGGRLNIDVREPAKDGRANKRLIAILKGLYPGQSLRIVSGERSPNKTILVGRE